VLKQGPTHWEPGLADAAGGIGVEEAEGGACITGGTDWDRVADGARSRAEETDLCLCSERWLAGIERAEDRALLTSGSPRRDNMFPDKTGGGRLVFILQGESGGSDRDLIALCGRGDGETDPAGTTPTVITRPVWHCPRTVAGLAVYWPTGSLCDPHGVPPGVAAGVAGGDALADQECERCIAPLGGCRTTCAPTLVVVCKLPLDIRIS